MKVNTLEFWEQVKREYERNYWGSISYICVRSWTFKQNWKQDEQKSVIVELSLDFISSYEFREYIIPFKFGVLSSYLFIEIKRDLSPMRVRTDFINFCIKKYTK